MESKIVKIVEKQDSDQSSYTEIQYENNLVGTLLVRVCSYNVNCKFSKKEAYEKWLNAEKVADIIAIGFQELYFKLMDVVAPDSKQNNKIPIAPHRRWLEFFLSLNFINHNYTLLLSKSYSGLCLFIFLRKHFNKKMSNHVSNLLVGTVPVGMLGMANKGALSISFRLGEFSICFINCHLPAGSENQERRQYSFQAVIQKLQLYQHNKTRSKKINFMEADIDVVFLFGDLNFRLLNTAAPAVIQSIKSNKTKAINELLQIDELIVFRETDALYKCFYEAQIDFLPTYKFVIDSSNYDLKRIPSYCDRILWMGNSCLNISYKSFPEFLFSDHKPVSADFIIDVREGTRRQSNKLFKAKTIPRIRIESTIIDFGNVYFMKNNTCEKEITNVGSVYAEVYFKTLDNSKEMPTWFTVIPSAMSLEPKASKIVQFRIFIDYHHVSNFNRNVDKFNCQIICASTVNGTDTPLTFNAQYHLNIFGIQLEVLRFIDRPIATYVPKDIIQLESSKNTSSFSIFHGNSLLDRIMNILMPRIKFDQSFEGVIIKETSNINSVLELIQKVNDATYPDSKGHLVKTTFSLSTQIEILLIFMKSLPQPIIPFVVQARLSTCSTDKHHILNVLHNLPRTNILFLRRFLHYLNGFIKKNTDIELIANFVVSCIPPSNPSLKDPLIRVISFLIEKPNML